MCIVCMSNLARVPAAPCCSIDLCIHVFMYEETNDKIKNFIEATRANRDVRVWYKQCIPRK